MQNRYLQKKDNVLKKGRVREQYNSGFQNFKCLVLIHNRTPTIVDY